MAEEEKKKKGKRRKGVNPSCPDCGSVTNKFGKQNENQRYRCTNGDCKRVFTGNPVGPPIQGEKIMTPSERWRKWYANLSAAERADYNSRRRARAKKNRKKK